VASFGRRVLFVTGRRSLERRGHREALSSALQTSGAEVLDAHIEGEPTPETIDRLAGQGRSFGVEVVLAVGGGSVLDAGKAIAAILPVEGSIVSYLEGVGDRAHPGVTLPMLAVPTTAGTGSEATQNAVITRVGVFKKSLRHPAFVPAYAVVDPELAVGVPRPITAACGMDALTQLLEGYLSTSATPFTDALALDGLRAGFEALPLLMAGADTVENRGKMAWAAFLSGITLAQAGLGLVHGLAGPLGAAVDIPHGVACGTLMAATNEATLSALVQQGQSLERMARVGQVLRPELDEEAACEHLVATLFAWTEAFDLPRLGPFGVDEALIERLSVQGANRNSPIALCDAHIAAVLRSRL